MNSRLELIKKIRKFTPSEIRIGFDQLSVDEDNRELESHSNDLLESLLIELDANYQQNKKGGPIGRLKPDEVILTFHPASEPPEPDTQILIEWGTEWVIGWYSAGIRIDEPPQGYCVTDWVYDDAPAYMGGGLQETWQLLELKYVKRWAYLPKEK